jgi:hypothetical protein
MGLRDKIFIRSLALVYFLAFSSLAFQVTGLMGEHGILPAGALLTKLKSQTVNLAEAWNILPTIFIFNSSDGFLKTVAYLGIIASILLFIKLKSSQRLALMTSLFVFYLSFVNIGQVFFGFQWDVLLLETGFLTAMYCFFYRYDFARTIFIFLYRLLVFKLMLMSGLVKLTSQDPNWANLNAMSFHYLTQPLPNPLSFFMHQLGTGFHKITCALMFGVELICPFFIFMNSRLRSFAGVAFIGLMLMIFLTGNYCFFNLLVIALCVWLFDENTLVKFIPKASIKLKFFKTPVDILNFKINERLSRMGIISDSLGQKFFRIMLRLFLVIILLYYIIANAFIILSRAPLSKTQSMIAFQQASKLTNFIQNYHIINAYGLFAIMTTKRYEIIIQGAEYITGQIAPGNWLDYEFYWKPGDPSKIPQQVAPYQPRIDWQMWFAALSNYQSQPWFVNLCIRILENEKEVVKLLKYNPFPKEAPRYLRAIVYEYKFNSLENYSKTGMIWSRELKGIYLPAIETR